MPYATPFWAKVYLTSNLSNDEEIQAFKDWNENSSWGSRDKIVLSYLKLVQKISRQKRIKLTNVDTEEFFSEGVLGLIRAIQLFDPSKG
ncbi:MAG: hypothetical protein LBQ43_00390 [Holosporales bacterium]|jgi:DNA-directed RNA polymerase specialized sigma subunit|nr:hypothetical protein [Holosporales bacterium]